MAICPSLPPLLPHRLQLRHLFPKTPRLAAEAQAGFVEAAGAGGLAHALHGRLLGGRVAELKQVVAPVKMLDLPLRQFEYAVAAELAERAFRLQVVPGRCRVKRNCIRPQHKHGLPVFDGLRECVPVGGLVLVCHGWLQVGVIEGKSKQGFGFYFIRTGGRVQKTVSSSHSLTLECRARVL